MTTLLKPENGAKVSLVTESQRAFLALPEESRMPKEGQIFDWENPVRSNRIDCSFAATVTFEFDTDEEESCFVIAQSEDFRDAVTVVTTQSGVTVDNLKMNTTYFWKVNDSAVHTFITEDDVPRWITVKGLSNVRDMGNWKTRDGRRVRQGLIYRGSEMDNVQTITEEGIYTLRHKLHIRTDLDLRRDALGRVTASPLGEQVQFFLIPASPYAGFMEDTPESRQVVYRIFSILAEKDNYPIFLHCRGGVDRTGTVILLLNAILGVDYEDLVLDYELSTLSRWGPRYRNNERYVGFMEALEQFEGTTVNEKAESFLRSVGVGDELLGKLRKNLLEEPEMTDGS